MVRCCLGCQDVRWDHSVQNLTGLRGQCCCSRIALASLGAPGRGWCCSFAGCGMASWASYWRSFPQSAKAVTWPSDPLTDARCLTKEKTCSSLCPDTWVKVRISDSHHTGVIMSSTFASVWIINSAEFKSNLCLTNKKYILSSLKRLTSLLASTVMLAQTGYDVKPGASKLRLPQLSTWRRC